MGGTCTLGVLSDIHYASPAEQARGHDYEAAELSNALQRCFLRFYRHFIWLRNPLEKNYLLDNFLGQARGLEYLITNGDYSCDSAFVGVSDDATFQSVHECLGKLRSAFGDRLFTTYGDHELGKMSFLGARGGMRLASWYRATKELGLKPFWQLRIGRYVCLGIVSSLVALPVFEPDTLPAERPEWKRLREEHLCAIRELFESLGAEDRVLIFCHDPTALHFLAQEPAVSVKLHQIDQTIIGHLHSNLVLWKSRWLAGMPRVGFLGHTAKRLSAALQQARDWAPFRVRLCPALAGVELLKDGGFLTIQLEPDGVSPPRFQFHSVSRLRTSTIQGNSPVV